MKIYNLISIDTESMFIINRSFSSLKLALDFAKKHLMLSTKQITDLSDDYYGHGHCQTSYVMDDGYEMLVRLTEAVLDEYKPRLDVNKIMVKKGFEIAYTGGGCHGWSGKKKGLWFYITTMSELTAPDYGEHASMGVYDKNNEVQFLSMDIKSFNPDELDSYIEKAIKKLSSKSIKDKISKAESQSDFKIIYI